MPEMKIVLEAADPMELMRNPFEQRVWIKLNAPPRNWWPEVEIRGEYEQVYNFVENHWGSETANEVVGRVEP